MDLRQRTKDFALDIVKLYTALPKTTESQVLGKQVLRSGTSIGAHYREALRARSDAEYISKLETALQELEETLYWLELLVDIKVVNSNIFETLNAQSNELIAVFVACVKTAKAKREPKR
jgi:four helix bundle protein